MTAIVPDTMQGALIVSVIDFFLSFVIISGIGVVLALFPWLNRAAKMLKRAPPTTAAAPQTKVVAREEEDLRDDIAAIAAAVAVVMDGTRHRIVHVEPSPRSGGWAAEGRVAHHGSHRPGHAKS